MAEPDEQPIRARVVILGPSAAEVARYAPQLYGRFPSDDWLLFHREVDEETDLLALTEEHNAWGDSIGRFVTLICLPHDARGDALTGHRRWKETGVPVDLELTPTIGLLALDQFFGIVAVGISDTEFIGPQHREVRRWLSNGILTDPRTSRRQRFLYQQRLGMTSAPCGGQRWVPEVVWHLDPQQEGSSPATFALMHRSELDVSPWGWEGHRLSHFRRLHGGMFRDVVGDEARASDLVHIALGKDSRTEDDVFVPSLQLVVADDWSVDVAEQRPHSFGALARLRGYHLKPVREIAAVIQDDDLLGRGEDDAHSLWFVWRGHNPLTARTARPTEPTLQEFGLEEDDDEFGRIGREYDYNEAVKLWPETKALRVQCHSVGERDFLMHALNDATANVDLRCRAMGSSDAPIITKVVLGDLQVPWPNQEERRHLLAELDAHRRVANSTDTEYLIEWAGELGHSVEWVKDMLNRAGDVSVYCLDGLWLTVLDTFERIEESLQEIPAWHVMRAMVKPRPQEHICHPPAPLAILRRRFRNEQESQAKLNFLVEIAEHAVKYDALLLLAVMAHLGRHLIANVFSSLPNGQRDDIRLSFGLWHQLGRKCRSYLSEVASEHVDPRLGRLWQAIRKVRPKQLDACVAPIIEQRNAGAKGHGTTAPETQRKFDCQRLEPMVSKLLDRLDYVQRFSLIHADNVSHLRRRTSLRARLLEGDNEDFEVREFSFPPDVLREVGEGEVYLQAGAETPELLPLYPWVLFQPGVADRSVIWLFDGISDEKVVYRSPQVPSNVFKTEEPFEDISKLLQ